MYERTSGYSAQYFGAIALTWASQNAAVAS
jgi:hypothetical protein